jgi:AmiR/NasT family two-component response regulator
MSVMANTRKLVAQFVGVFVIGALVGGLLTNSLSDTALTMAMSHWNNADALEDQAADEATGAGPL